MNITIEQLIQCVKESVKTLTVKTPEYKPLGGHEFRTGNWVESDVDVVDPVTLIDELEKLIEDGHKQDSTTCYAIESWED